MTTQCPRCGKQNVDPIYPHTCTPLALTLADALERGLTTQANADKAAAELRRLHELNEDLYQQGVGFIARIGKLEAELERAVLAEREACAKLCDALHWPWRMGDESGPKECAAAIRARGAAPQQEGEPT